jgi:hypothetical protein
VNPDRSLSMQLRAIVLAIASFAVVLACHDANGPQAPGAEAGVYVARALEGRSIPALIDSGPLGFAVLDADTVILDGLGGAVRATTSHHVSATYGASAAHFRITLAYRLRGDSIEIGSFRPCPPNADCVGNERGVLRGPSLSLVRYYPFHTEFVRAPTPGLD